VSFTKKEISLLARFVTNVDKPVFVLVNLPEVLKGALFSRYSRSTKGLRRLLIDEFLNNPDGGFSVSDHDGAPADRLVNLSKAKKFYDRILDGYGDDSIGELGGAHLALEKLSNLATKAIQDCRIGGSPLEKSTRYVRFDEKINGKFQYYRDPAIMSSQHADQYIQAMDGLFELYSRSLDPLMGFLEEEIPQSEGTPKWAYKASIRARACDALRGILPASTLTNMGVFGNGRFFETLLIKLRNHSLKELRDLGALAHDELDKVIPSFVRRAHPDNRHFPSMAEHQRKVFSAVKWASASATDKLQIEDSEEVVLVNYQEDAQDLVLAAILYPQTGLPFKQLLRRVRDLGEDQRANILQSYLSARSNRRHKPGRALENAYYTFDILADFGSYRDLQRHRMLTQERQLLSIQHGYAVPSLINETGLKENYQEVMDVAGRAFAAIATDMLEEAQYAVPFGYRLRWYFTINLRALSWLCELRSSPQGHPDYRRIAQRMFQEVERVHPHLAKAFQFVDMNDYQLGRLDSEVRKEKKKEERQIADQLN